VFSKHLQGANMPNGEISWLDEVQRPPDPLPKEAPRLAGLLHDDAHLPIESAEQWKARRAQLQGRWLEFLGMQHFPTVRPDLKREVLEEDRPGCVRQLVRYETEEGLPVEGYLLFPERIQQRLPGVVVLHSTVDYSIRQPAGLEGPPEMHIGLKLARRGYVAFCPRCFLWQGTNDYQKAVTEHERRHPGSRGMAKMLWDAWRAVDLLESLDTVDGSAIGAAGHSLGAKEALYLAAFDERVRATVSSEGGIGLGFSNWEAPWYLGGDIRRPGFPLENHQVLAMVAPRPFLLLGGDSADGDRSWPFIAAVMPIYDLLASPRRIGLFNHRQGHALPPEAEQRLYGWLDHYLGRPV
jgi:hypothetical protein